MSFKMFYPSGSEGLSRCLLSVDLQACGQDDILVEVIVACLAYSGNST